MTRRRFAAAVLSATMAVGGVALVAIPSHGIVSWEEDWE